ncbi:hypothetical protein LE856_001776 [Neisseria gonorrhoeae]
MKNKKQPAQAVLVCINLNPNSHPVLSPVGEGWREGNKPQGLYLGGEGIRKDCHHSENALSPALPRAGEGADCGRFGGCRRFEKQLGFTVDFRSYEK